MSQFKRKLSAFTALLALVSFSGATYAVTSSDVIRTTKNAEVIDISNKRTDINVTGGQAGAVAQVDFSKFNVAEGEHVNYGFSNISQTMINRVLGGQESRILGKITNSCINGGSCSSYAATGKVILINPAGVMFGQGSTVDLNSFTASTFDFNGAKNLKNMTESQLNNYQNNVLNKLSPTKTVNGTSNAWGDINFDSNYTTALDAGLKDNGVTEGISKFQGKTKITLDGTHFDKFNYDSNYNITGVADKNTNKSVNIVSDNVDYRDSLIRTGSNYNYADYDQSFGNVRIVTADGVTFKYLANGYASKYAVADDTKNNVKRNISIDNSNLAANKTGIEAGDIRVINKSNAANSNVKVKNTLIKANKMVNGENGNILITGSNDVEIASSRMDTVNTSVTKNGVTKDTTNKAGGEVYISADKNLNVNDSLIITSGSTDASAETAGAVRLYSQGNNVNIKNTKVLSDGKLDAIAYDNIDVQDSLLQASNTVKKANKKNATISGAGGVNIKNTTVDATGNVDILSKYTNNKVAGNINISSTKKDGQNQTLIIAGDDLSVEGANTTIDNASLAYDNIKFYNNKTTGINNVTVKNDSTFSPRMSDGKISRDITLETNGDFTMDKATMKAASYSLKFDRVNPSDETSKLIDDGTPSAIGYNITITPANANNLTVTSTEGNVNVQNASNIATKNTTLNSNKKDVNVKNSTLTATNNINVNAAKDATINKSTLDADNDVNVTAKGGALYITNSPKIAADNNINLTSYETIKFGNDSDNVNIGKSSDIQAGKNINVKSTNGNIEGEKTTMPTLKYGSRLAFDAKGKNIFTSADSLKSVNVDYIAGEANTFYTTEDIQFVNSTLKAPTNFVESGKDVILNATTIEPATANPEDTVTKIYANGIVTTKDVTGTAANDVAKAVKEYPQSVSTTRTGTGRTVLNVNETKLIVQTDTVKDPNFPDNGSITLDVKNADNPNAGVDLTAQNVKALDKDPTGGYNKPGYYKSGEPQWDGDVEPLEHAIAEKQGPEVTLNATDDYISIANIDADKLTLDPNDEKIADTTKGTPTIRIKDQGGFNLDPTIDYKNDPNGFNYDKNYGTTETKTEQEFGPWGPERFVRREENPDGSYTDVYVKTRNGQTTETTVHKDPTHDITFDNGDSFKLIYDKKDTTENVTTIKGDDVYDKTVIVPNPEEYYIERRDDCPTPPPVDFDADSLIDAIRLPKEQAEISKNSTVADGTADQTATVVSAAAKIVIAPEDIDAINTVNDDDKKELDY